MVRFHLLFLFIIHNALSYGNTIQDPSVIVVRYQRTDPSFSDLSSPLSAIGINEPTILVVDAYDASTIFPSSDPPIDPYTAAYNISFLGRELLLWKALSVLPHYTSYPPPTPTSLARSLSHILALELAYQKGYETVLVLESTLPMDQSVQAWSRAGITIQDVISEVGSISSGQWEVLQLSFKNDPILSGDVDAVKRGELIVHKDPCGPGLIYQGSEAYLIRRSRIAALLMRISPLLIGRAAEPIDLRSSTLRFDVDYLLYSTSYAYRTTIPISPPRLWSLEDGMTIMYKAGLDRKVPMHTWNTNISSDYIYLDYFFEHLKDRDLHSGLAAALYGICSNQEPPCRAQFQVLMDNFWDLCGNVHEPSDHQSIRMMFVHDSTLVSVQWGADGNSRPPLGLLFPFCDEPFEHGGSKFLGLTAGPGKCRNLAEAALVIDMLYMTNRANTTAPLQGPEVQEAVAKLDGVRVAGFWHIGRMGTMWQDIVKDQMKKILDSGLDKRAHVIHAVMAGHGEELPVSHPKLNVRQGPGLGSYEFPTLALLEAYCVENPDDLVWYMHSKGVSKSPKDVKNVVGCSIWRDYMDHFIITRWQECLAVLGKGYDTCGVTAVRDNKLSPGRYTFYADKFYWGASYLRNTSFHYAGNFWWARCTHINRLPRISTLNQTDRFQAELWIGKARHIKVAECMNTLAFYYRRYEPYEYENVDGCRAYLQPGGAPSRDKRLDFSESFYQEWEAFLQSSVSNV